METITKEIQKGVTKSKQSYDLYTCPRTHHKAKVYNDKSIDILTPNGRVLKLSELTTQKRGHIQPFINFIEADLSHKFTIAENEIE